MLILELLRYAAAPPSPAAAEKVASALRSAKPRALQWALDAGLGPLLYEVSQDAPASVPAAYAEGLLSADLTARVLQGNRVEAAEEIVDACTAIGVPVTLLKGISISEQHYPSPHHRTMTDIDILVPGEAFAAVETEAKRLGYRQTGEGIMGPDPHHGEPLYHLRRQAVLEIHTALFPAESRLNRGKLFSPGNLSRQSVPSTFRGRPIRRLSNELQLVYVASYWAADLCGQPIHPSLLMPLVDAARILSNEAHHLDWDRILKSLDNEQAAASLYLMLAYLGRRHIVELPASVVPRLAASQAIVGAGELRIIHALVDRYLVGGRPFKPFNSWHIWATLMAPGSHLAKLMSLPWNILFPPSYPDRYSVRSQLARAARYLRGARRADVGPSAKRSSQPVLLRRRRRRFLFPSGSV